MFQFSFKSQLCFFDVESGENVRNPTANVYVGREGNREKWGESLSPRRQVDNG